MKIVCFLILTFICRIDIYPYTDFELGQNEIGYEKCNIPESSTEIYPNLFSHLSDDLSRFLRTKKLSENESPWMMPVKYFGNSFNLINALIITIIICIITMIFLLIIILLNRNKMEREKKLTEYLQENYQSLIVDYLFGEDVIEEMKKIASDRFCRQVLIDQIIDISVNLKGNVRENLKKLYQTLNLDQDSLKNAKSRKWHIKVKGFRELAFMNIKKANDKMYAAINSRNDILRMEAQIALVRLNEDNPFEFLSHIESPFSLWEQITLHELLVQHSLPVPEFKQWINSPNPTVVMFALRMIREFKQPHTEEDIKMVLTHPDPKVRHLAIEVTGDMKIKSCLPVLKRIYKSENYNNCLEILRSITKMPDPSMLGFLKLVLDKEDDVQLQIEAVRGIEGMGELGVSTLVKLMESEYKNYNIIIKHVLDKRIN